MSEDKVEIDENEKELPSVEKSDQAINDNSETHIEDQNDFAKNKSTNA